MEQNQDLKNELQQDLRDLQHDIQQHSTFNTDVWRRMVRRHVRGLYRLNLICSVFLIIFIVVITPWLFYDNLWPWWLIILVDLLIISLTIYSLIVSRGMRRPDMYSKSGLLSLRESVQRSSNTPKRHKAIIYAVGGIITVLLFIYIYKNDPDLLSAKLIGGIAGLLAGLLIARRLKKQYRNLSEEIDELLKEE
jgi:glucan phosphoethanolaminetransferase (alkaline phosphatase superfamily)